MLRVGGNLQCLQPQRFDHLQQAVIRGRLNRHGIAGARRELQGNRHGFLAAIGNQHLFRSHRALHARQSTGNLGAQLRCPGREFIPHTTTPLLTQHTMKNPLHGRHRHKFRRRHRRAEIDHRRVVHVLQHLQNLFLPGDLARFTAGRRHPGRLAQHRRLPDVIPRAGARLQHTALFQLPARIHRRGHADLLLFRQHPHAGQTATHRVYLITDQPLQTISQTLIESHKACYRYSFLQKKRHRWLFT